MSEKDTQSQAQQIDELVETQVSGMAAGVCGREYCERCGQLGSFTGFNGALALHLDWNRFTCSSCWTAASEAAETRRRNPGLDDLILERGYRYCWGCGRPVILSERTLEEARRRPLTCPSCHGIDYGKAARRRYIEHEATKPNGLERAAARIRWAKNGIEAILNETEDSER